MARPERGSGCDECGYTGKRRRAEWVPLTGEDFVKIAKVEDRRWARKHARGKLREQELQRRVGELRTRFQSYDGGDRPMSPPAELIEALWKAEDALRAAKEAGERKS